MLQFFLESRNKRQESREKVPSALLLHKSIGFFPCLDSCLLILFSKIFSKSESG
nr:MAG TPA: hypothetical protein [Caudoviricetes sp.]